MRDTRDGKKLRSDMKRYTFWATKHKKMSRDVGVTRREFEPQPNAACAEQHKKASRSQGTSRMV
jgi:hypothetical protein